MKNLKLMMFAAAGLLAPAIANADIARIQSVKMIPSPTTDLAEVTGTPARLRRQNERQPGAEDSTFSINADGKGGVMYVMSTELKGQRPGAALGVQGNAARMQLAAVPFTFKQMTDGSVTVEPNLAAAKFVTRNNGDEYRNANFPSAFNVGASSCVEYNYQVNNGNDTKRYIACFNPSTLAPTLDQTLLYAKNNDDCSMNQDGQSTALISAVGGKYRFAAWRGCNGNGNDNAWYQQFTLNEAADGKITLTKNFDLTTLAREERSRGSCFSPDPTDAKFVVCAGTEGNTQPQRDGTWLLGIDADEAKYNGANQQQAILWKMQIGGRKTIGNQRTYAMRASIHPILAPDTTTGLMKGNGTILYRQGQLQGNNNTNGKGGQYIGNEVGVLKVSRQGAQFITPMTDLAKTVLFGMDGTHLKFEYAMFGETGSLKPGFIFHGGSHTGGGYASTAKVVMWDGTANAFADGGSFGVASHDRHLYPNYTGNNPGNQGRNHSDAQLIANPFVGMNGNRDAYLMVVTTTGKDPAEMTDPRKKLSTFMTVMPVAQNPAPQPQPEPQPQPSGQQDDPTTPEDETQTGGAQSSDSTLGGCSTGGSTGAASLLLIGLAAFVQRRRR